MDQSLLQVAGLGSHLLKQPDIFDGDDCLIGEGLDQFDLTRSKKAGFGLRQRKHPFDFSFPHDRDAQHRAELTHTLVAVCSEISICKDVWNLNYFRPHRRTPYIGSDAGGYRVRASEGQHLRRVAVLGSDMKEIAAL